MTNRIDLGSDHSIEVGVWDPDLDLNPELRPLASQFPAKVSAIVRHLTPGGAECEGAITFDVPLARQHFSGPFWTVDSWDPLTLRPSLLCHCGDHGFIRDGKWVSA